MIAVTPKRIVTPPEWANLAYQHIEYTNVMLLDSWVAFKGRGWHSGGRGWEMTVRIC
jgi:hypothetical protein